MSHVRRLAHSLKRVRHAGCEVHRIIVHIMEICDVVLPEQLENMAYDNVVESLGSWPGPVYCSDDSDSENEGHT